MARAVSLLAVIATAGGPLSLPLQGYAGEGRLWQLSDSVGVRYFSADMFQPDTWPVAESPGAIVWAPDRSAFFLISHRGNIAEDSNVYTMSVFVTRDVVNQVGN